MSNEPAVANDGTFDDDSGIQVAKPGEDLSTTHHDAIEKTIKTEGS